MSNKSAYVVLFHKYKPSRTAIGKTEVHEEINFLSSLKDKHIRESTIILDYTKQTLVKDRTGTCTVESIVSYCKEKYPALFSKFEDVVGLESPTTTQESNDGTTEEVPSN